MCKNGMGLFAQKWLLFLEIWWIKFLQNDKQHLLLKFFAKIFIFDWVIAIFIFFDEWWRHILVHLKKYDHIMIMPEPPTAACGQRGTYVELLTATCGSKYFKQKISWERTFKRFHNWVIYWKDGFFLGFTKEVQKEPPEVVYKTSCSSKFFNINRKTLLLESLLIKL